MGKLISVGKYRALERASLPQGVFTVLALDHQDALRRALNPSTPDQVTDDELIEFKLDVLGALAENVSGALLDPVWGAPFAVAAGHTGHLGLLVELEKADYGLAPLPLQVELRERWSVSKIKRMGADGVKLFFYYHPDDPTHATAQSAIVKAAVSSCDRYDIPLYAEPIRFPMPGETPGSQQYADDTTRVVVQSARDVGALGADVLKLEFPIAGTDVRHLKAWIDKCAEVSEAIDIPWVVLSAGVDFETFAQQVEAACKGGASGFIVGRALWAEACSIGSKEARIDWLYRVAKPRLQRLTEITTTYGKNWKTIFAPSAPTINWYMTYEDCDV